MVPKHGVCEPSSIQISGIGLKVEQGCEQWETLGKERSAPCQNSASSLKPKVDMMESERKGTFTLRGLS